MKVKTHNRGSISQIFYCHDCGKDFQENGKARKQAYNHAKRTGHRVTGDTTIGITYN